MTDSRLADSILVARAAAVTEFLEANGFQRSPEGKTVKQLDKAYESATGEAAPPLVGPPPARDSGSNGQSKSGDPKPKPKPKPKTKSIRVLVEEILSDGGQRLWRYPDLENELAKKGRATGGAPVRNAVHTLVQTNQVERSPEGGAFWWVAHGDPTNPFPLAQGEVA